jgi:hypothetical protein
MNHPFLSRRTELERARLAVTLARDVCWLTTLTEHEAVRARRETEIRDAKVREAVLRHVGRLGHLLEDLDAAAGCALAKDHGAAWTAFWRDGAPMSRAFQAAVEDASRAAEARVSTLAVFEEDAGSSSYSDYSDSDTESTADEETEETEDDDDDEPAKKQRRR